MQLYINLRPHTGHISEAIYWAYFRSNKPNTYIIGNQIVQREGKKHRKVEWVVTLSTFIPTRERKMEDINVLTIPKLVFIYLFIYFSVFIKWCS
jgi:hypothetical protein